MDKKIGSPNSTTGCSPLAMVEKNGFIYVAGSFTYSSAPGMDFDPDGGTNYYQSVSSADFFVAKYNASTGAHIWAYTGGSSGGGSDIPTGIGADDNENIYLTGYVNNGATPVDFDIKAGTAASANAIASTTNVFLVKYTKDCDFVWRVNVTNSNGNSGGSLVVDNVNNYVYFGGGLTQSSGSNPIFSGVSLPVNASSRDAFLAKYDFNGNRQWVNNIASGSSSNYVWGLDTDNAGNIYVSGVYQGTADFDPVGTRNLTAVGSLDAFFAKYNSSGNHVWSYGIGSASFGEAGYGIKVDGSGNMVIGGAMLGQADYNPEGTGGPQLKGNNGERQIFFGEYDTDFKYVWAHAISSSTVTSFNNYANAVALDRSQTPSPVYVWGYFRNNSTQDFDPNNAGGNYTATGTQDNGFLAKYSTLNVLPIKLSYFKAINKGDVVELYWETYSEVNNDFFTIQRSKDGLVWSDISKQKGAGNSNINLSYNDIDYNPYEGVSYYRLKQTDFDGKVSFSKLQMVNITNASIAFYPNPTNKLIVFNIKKSLNLKDAKIRIKNAVGKVVLNYNIVPATSGFFEINIQHLPRGIYYLSFISHEMNLTEKIIINNHD